MAVAADTYCSESRIRFFLLGCLFLYARPSNVDENDISQLCTPNIEERARRVRSVRGTTNLTGAYRLRRSLFKCFDIKAVIIWSIEVERLLSLHAHLC